MSPIPVHELTVVIKGAGEMASAAALRLFRANIRLIVMLDIPRPLAVRRLVSFCEAILDQRQTVEGVEAVAVRNADEVRPAWQRGKIAVAADPRWRLIDALRPDVVVDATLAKKNLGTAMDDAPLVIGLGPGFTAGRDVHMVVETNRGHDLGRIITRGAAAPNTGIPGDISGYRTERVLRSPAGGIFKAHLSIGAMVSPGDLVGTVAGKHVRAGIGGVLRGLIRSGTSVSSGLKIGDIDPRGEISYCSTISDKARAISGSVLEAVLRVYAAPGT